ncbi:hypothetical protein [Piscirickettsia salmonis]|uniref:hypothetical protein n=1 Tax=Piscirickettsia salmonis TaxID=1238 RepID=UPI0002F49D45|nr:hypothetical protein [Piscirickettsia salmonis]ERL62367.1 hypothetical protein K661_01265 [Piscirickettsia salmonis LF-89 = ATCC VR-1361]APS58003.1 hypothetical protein AVI52_12610 [Piscirickettsia salmonis]PEQ15922.1 hypothetical protein X973_10180 [Piscirickettsia salmonis]QGN76320.1 chromosome segregation protein SMC [Piscirickettsia salmonis]QGN79881.1 chromosome segregation protein SMC [Piscirickettsia salmonis]
MPEILAQKEVNQLEVKLRTLLLELSNSGQSAQRKPQASLNSFQSLQPVGSMQFSLTCAPFQPTRLFTFFQPFGSMQPSCSFASLQFLRSLQSPKPSPIFQPFGQFLFGLPIGGNYRADLIKVKSSLEALKKISAQTANGYEPSIPPFRVELAIYNLKKVLASIIDNKGLVTSKAHKVHLEIVELLGNIQGCFDAGVASHKIKELEGQVKGNKAEIRELKLTEGLASVDIDCLKKSVESKIDTIVALEQEAASASNVIECKDKRIAELETNAVAREEIIAATEKVLASKSATLTKLEEVIAAASQALKSTDKVVESKNEEIVRLEGKIECKNQTIVEVQKKVVELEKTVASKDKLTTAMGKAMVSRDKQITSQGQEINLLKQSISEFCQSNKSSLEASGGESPCIFEGHFSNGQSGTAVNSGTHVPSTNH